jgi:hypothetical protein
MVSYRRVVAGLVAATILSCWSATGQAALLTYDYTARFVNDIGPYDSSVWGTTASGSFTLDTGAAGSGGIYPNALSFSLDTPSGIAVTAGLDLQLIDHAPGAGQDAVAAHSTSIGATIPVAGASPRSLSLFWADDSGTALSSTVLADLPPLSLASFTNAGLGGDYILFGFNDTLRSGAQGEYSLTSLHRRTADTVAVAEPAGLAVLASGLIALAMVARRRA